MAATDIPYEELVGSCSFSFAKGGSSATRIFKVAWSDAVAFATWLRGSYKIWPPGEFEPPNSFPYAPFLQCESVRVEGLGVPGESFNADGPYITYEYAKITAQYGHVLNVSPDNPEIVEEENISVATEMLTLPDTEYEWTSDGTPIKGDVMPGKITSTTHFSITRYHVASLPDLTVSSLTGKVNDAEWRGYDPEHVVFAGAEARRSTTVDGAEDWELTYHFLIKRHSWNHAYRDKIGAAEAVRTKNGHDPIYESGDFTTLGLSA